MWLCTIYFWCVWRDFSNVCKWCIWKSAGKPFEFGALLFGIWHMFFIWHFIPLYITQSTSQSKRQEEAPTYRHTQYKHSYNTKSHSHIHTCTNTHRSIQWTLHIQSLSFERHAQTLKNVLRKPLLPLPVWSTAPGEALIHVSTKHHQRAHPNLAGQDAPHQAAKLSSHQAGMDNNLMGRLETVPSSLAASLMETLEAKTDAVQDKGYNRRIR